MKWEKWFKWTKRFIQQQWNKLTEWFKRINWSQLSKWLKLDKLTGWKKWAAPLLAAVLLVVMVVTGIILLTAGKRTPTVGICVSDMQQSAEYVRKIELALIDRGYNVRIVDAKGDHTLQTQQLAQLADDGVDGLVISPVMGSASDALVKTAQAADIPVVFFNRQPDEATMDMWSRISYVGSDPVQAGALQAELVLGQENSADINDDGIVCYVIVENDPQRLDTQQYFTGVETAFANSGIKTKMLSRVSCDGGRAGGKTVFARELANLGKDIEAVICNNDQIALGALDAIIDGGRTVGKDIYLIGNNAHQASVDAATTAQMTATVQTDFDAQAETIARVLRQLLNYEKTQKQYTVAYRAIMAISD